MIFSCIRSCPCLHVRSSESPHPPGHQILSLHLWPEPIPIKGQTPPSLVPPFLLVHLLPFTITTDQVLACHLSTAFVSVATFTSAIVVLATLFLSATLDPATLPSPNLPSPTLFHSSTLHCETCTRQPSSTRHTLPSRQPVLSLVNLLVVRHPLLPRYATSPVEHRSALNCRGESRHCGETKHRRLLMN